MGDRVLEGPTSRPTAVPGAGATEEWRLCRIDVGDAGETKVTEPSVPDQSLRPGRLRRSLAGQAGIKSRRLRRDTT